MIDERPFVDVVWDGDNPSLPELKWRELLFTGALRRVGDTYVRDPDRPMPPFAGRDPFPEGVRYTARAEAGRVRLLRTHTE